MEATAPNPEDQIVSPKRHARIAAASIALTALVVLAGCGSSSNNNTTSSPAAASSTPAATSSASTGATSSTASSAAAGAEKLSLEANPSGQLKYNTTSLSAKAGTISIDFKNMAEIAHNVTIESSSGQVVGHTPTFSGGTKTLTLSLKAGTYKFFCSVPGHRMAGMEGTLTLN